MGRRTVKPRRSHRNTDSHVLLQQACNQERIHLDIRQARDGSRILRSVHTLRKPHELRDLRRTYRPALGIHICQRRSDCAMPPYPALRSDILSCGACRHIVHVLGERAAGEARTHPRHIPHNRIPDKIPFGVHQERPGSLRGRHGAQHGTNTQHSFCDMGSVFDNKSLT